MRISEVVADLLRLQAKHGDLEVRAYSYAEIDDSPVAEPAVHAPGVGPAYVLIEP
ncbi:hypothetical protein ACFWVB_20165 [Streptomyces microflavus]|uniref:hypothetical protein n=1 Tax=Streptomyces microflavus TaxID=1919 RepID=UPI00364CB7EF